MFLICYFFNPFMGLKEAEHFRTISRGVFYSGFVQLSCGLYMFRRKGSDRMGCSEDTDTCSFSAAELSELIVDTRSRFALPVSLFQFGVSWDSRNTSKRIFATRGVCTHIEIVVSVESWSFLFFGHKLMP